MINNDIIKLTQRQKSAESYYSDIMSEEGTHSMKNLNPNYIIGLVDGEGSFTVYVRNPTKISCKPLLRRVQVEPRFYLKLIEKDKEILYKLKDFFGCGSVYFQKDSRPNHQNCYRYEVYNRDDLRKIVIPFFKKNILKFPSKKKDFIIFCKMFELIDCGYHLKESGLRKLFELKQQMH